jgi:hypothetical protein
VPLCLLTHRALANGIVLCRIFGFLLGSTLAGAGTYYYILEEYKVSNELLTEDIYVSRDSVDELYERVAI